MAAPCFPAVKRMCPVPGMKSPGLEREVVFAFLLGADTRIPSGWEIVLSFWATVAWGQQYFTVIEPATAGRWRGPGPSKHFEESKRHSGHVAAGWPTPGVAFECLRGQTLSNWQGVGGGRHKWRVLGPSLIWLWSLFKLNLEAVDAIDWDP